MPRRNYKPTVRKRIDRQREQLIRQLEALARQLTGKAGWAKKRKR
jgi:hypothetical protein